MPGCIFLIQSDQQLVEMREQAYDSEDRLQQLLVKYPSLLAGDQIETSNPRRFLLIKREMAIPSEDDGADRWSVDHVFVDQDAIPTLIEVKRSTDTRIRREVVGQMLDYAANAVVYWPVEALRSQFEQNYPDSDQQLRQFLGDDADPEAFWQKAKTNLQAGRIRMVFVADVIPPELRRIVEFLNEQMDPAEVLAIEIKQYAGLGMRTLVPRILGLTEKKKPVGSVRRATPWDDASFFAEMDRARGSVASQIARRLLDWTRRTLGEPKWGLGSKVGSFQAGFIHHDRRYVFFSVTTWGSYAPQFGHLMNSPPFDDFEQRKELARRLNTIPDVNINNLEGYPELRLTTLQDEANITRFLEAMEWAVQSVKST
jgi:hypothetical protein